MKFPSHIILDISKQNISNSSQYWALGYLLRLKKNYFFSTSLTIHYNYLLQKHKKLKNILIANQKKFTIKYKPINDFLFLSDTDKNFYTSFFAVRYKVKNRDFFSKHPQRQIFRFSQTQHFKFDEDYITKLLLKFKFNQKLTLFRNKKLWLLFDIIFLRKERIYTKLKYSRVPQYDIVSGGVAALFAGFLGFLISEKFGIELVDSGDFYFLFMYIVFISFFLRLFLKIMDKRETSWSFFSIKWLVHYYQIIVNLVVNSFKNFFSSK